MSNNDIKAILSERDGVKFATTAGSDMHKRLGLIVIDGDNTRGDSELVAHIQSIPCLGKLFCSNSMTEVPIAGTIKQRFISRRIDRLYIDNDAQTVFILDYKTDVNRDKFHDTYVAQVHEYAALLRQIYPKYKCVCYILWTHEWELEKV